MKCVVHIVGSFLDKNDSEVYVGYLCGLGQFGDGLAVAMVLGAMVVLSGALVGRFGPQWSMPVLVVPAPSSSPTPLRPFSFAISLWSVMVWQGCLACLWKWQWW